MVAHVTTVFAVALQVMKIHNVKLSPLHVISARILVIPHVITLRRS
jgi:hypothetical protein